MQARVRVQWGMAVVGLALCAGCGEGMRVGGDVANSLFGGTPPATAPAHPAAPAPTPGPGQPQSTPTPPNPPGVPAGVFTRQRPWHPIPPGTRYGNDVITRMRAAGGPFKRRSLWSKEFDERPVVGEGRVTQSIIGIAAGNHLQLWIDVDDDQTADVVFNYMMGGDPMELTSSLTATEGDMVWYEGAMKRYSAERLYVLGTELR